MTPSGRPTKILLCSYAFHPSIGGIETTSLFLAEQLTRRGLDVSVVTHSLDSVDNKQAYPYAVYRRPGRSELLQLVRRSNLVYQNNISLNYLWPLALAPRPLVITHQTPIDETIEKSALKRWLKVQVMRTASCTACSQYLADTFPVPSQVIYNPLRNIFTVDRNALRDRELIFVGRLSDAKGVDVLLHALHLLKRKGVMPGLTLVGGGGEEQKLKTLGTELGLDSQLVWVGPKGAAEIAQLLNRHQIMVVPSRLKPAEALGIVAIEGIACGAVPVVAKQGGLPEAIGPCGMTFECENPQSLADTLERLLGNAQLQTSLREPAAEFLRRFGEETILKQYLEVFAAALPGKRLYFGKT